MMNITRSIRIVAVASALALVAAPAAAQQGPLADFLLTGYGTASYSAGLDDFQSGFSASVSPIVLYRLGTDVLFETELEFEVEGSSTNTILEYAQVDYLGLDRMVFSLGKFLMPFGVFGERLHPSWINKMPTMPLLYGHAHGGQASGALLPIMSDIGVMARYNQPLSTTGMNLNLSLYVTQGPQEIPEDGLSEDGHAHAVAARTSLTASPGHDGPEPATAASFVIPDVAFGISFPDNNKNKLLGARLGLVKGPLFEVYLSGFHSMYDANDFLDLTGANLSFEYRAMAGELRTEATLLRQEFSDNGTYRVLTSPGYYIQYAHRLGSFEPVVRWSHLLNAEVGATDVRLERRELALGMEYWLQASVPLKLAYALDPDGEDRLILQWAIGF